METNIDDYAMRNDDLAQIFERYSKLCEETREVTGVLSQRTGGALCCLQQSLNYIICAYDELERLKAPSVAEVTALLDEFRQMVGWAMSELKDIEKWMYLND